MEGFEESKRFSTDGSYPTYRKTAVIQTCILMWNDTIQQKQCVYIQFSGSFRFLFVSRSGISLIIFFFPTKVNTLGISEPPVGVSARNRQKSEIRMYAR